MPEGRREVCLSVTPRPFAVTMEVMAELTTVAFTMRPRPPFRLDYTAWALRRGAQNILDRWEGATYRRTLSADGLLYELSVRQEGPAEKALLRVEVTANRPTPHLAEAARAALAPMLGTEIDLGGFYARAAHDPLMATLAARFRGVKPPRFPTLFEALVNGILFQQISRAAGTALLGRFVAGYGETASTFGGPAFPHPAAVAQASIEALKSLGLSTSKARAVQELARRLADGLDLAQIAGMDDEAALAFLEGLRGVGRWTAQYALLRGAGRLNIFPANDAGARQRLRRLLGLPEVPREEAVQDVAAAWAPYGGMLYFHLLLSGLAEQGYVVPTPV